MEELNKFYVIGYNYKDLDIKQRETVLKNNPEKIVEELFINKKITGFVFLSTCLRIEFYFYVNDDFKLNSLLDELHDESYYFKKGIEALKYLFNLTCGMDSIIIGENQILSQIKNSYSKYLDGGKTTGQVNKIFNEAIALGKKFRHLSKINRNEVSLERIIFNFIKKQISDFENKTFLLVGTGDIICSVLQVLNKEGIRNIILTTRTEHKAKKIKEDFDIISIDFKDKYKAIEKADIIISATSAPHYIIKKDELVNHIDLNCNKLFLDLAVPRDIEESISQLEGIKIFNIENIFEMHSINMKKRKEISEEFNYLVDEQIQKCIEWFNRKNKTWVNEKLLSVQEEASSL